MSENRGIAPVRGEARAYSRLGGPVTYGVYGIGGAATGATMAGLSSFVLLFYNLVLGVPASLVGIAMALALVFDAVSDPIVGYLSDRCRTRWGRRHPFMYAALVPVSLLLYAVWNPPAGQLGPQGLFLYLLGTIVPLRLALTLFEVPSTALIPELTTDYDGRTRLAVYRTACNFGAISIFSILLYGYWLRNTSEHPNGLLNPGGYGDMGQVAAIFAFAAMLASAAGLHRFIPHLRQPQNVPRTSLQGMVRDLAHTFSERSLRPLLAGGLLFAGGMGIALALFSYVYAYFWGLETARISGVMVIWAVGVPLGFMVAPLISRNREKKTVARGALLALLVVESGAVFLRLIGAFPGPQSPWTYPILLALAAGDMIAYLIFVSTWTSMAADVVEVRELSTGTREEGAIYAAQTLILKAASGIGVWLGGVVLELVRFPSGADVSDVPVETIRSLGIVYVAAIGVFYLLGFAVVGRYSLRREDHHAHLEKLRASRASSDGTASGVELAQEPGASMQERSIPGSCPSGPDRNTI